MMTIIGRAKIIDLFIFWSFFLNLKEQTLFVCINLFDNYLLNNDINKEELNLLFITCIFLSAKFEEVKLLKMKDLLKICEDKIDLNKNNILEMEKKILLGIGFNLIFVSPYDFMNRLFFLTNCDSKDCFLKRYLELLFIRNSRFLSRL